MANLQERRGKNGKLVSYSIRVHRGRGADGRQLKPWTATFDVSPTWSEKTARKKAEAFASAFEKQCKEGLVSDTRQTFAQYAEYVLALKEQRGDAHKSIVDYRSMAARIYPELGHVKLRDLQAHHLNAFYGKLMQPGQNKRTGGGLSAKTVLRYHRFISIVLAQAVKEGLVPFNAASRAEPPRAEKHKADYLQPADISAINAALLSEPLKWRALVHLLMITGARRGEVLGLKWEDVDLERGRVFICRSISYTPDRGVYEGKPKTKSSERYVAIPPETVSLLREYRVWQIEERFRLGEYYQDMGYVFTRDTGAPMHPDSVTTWLDRFSKRHGLPHLHPHAFRHTAASMLLYAGMDVVSVASRLGHSQVSTTTDVYAHVLAEADVKSADILSEIYFKSSRTG